jgi:anti-anti-sigma factor
VTERNVSVRPGELGIDLIAETPPRLVVAGEIDMATSEKFAQHLVRAAREHRPVIVDLRPTSFMDSQGVLRLVNHHDKVVAVWVRRNGLPSRVLTLSGLENYLNVVSR